MSKPTSRNPFAPITDSKQSVFKMGFPTIPLWAVWGILYLVNVEAARTLFQTSISVSQQWLLSAFFLVNIWGIRRIWKG